MKLFQTTHNYNYEWSLVSAANWEKYPNEKSPHVQHVDVLNRRIDPETGILTTERLITVHQNIPTIIKKILGTGSTQYAREISIIDPKKKTLTIHSINLTMSNLLTCKETIVYSEDSEDKFKTRFTQQAAIAAGSLVSRWGGVLEEFSYKRFKQNADVGREGFAKVLERFATMAEEAAQSKASVTH